MTGWSTPSFWYQPSGLLSALLSPIGAIYGQVTVNRLRRADTKPSTPPVICIGNLTAGGGGKTPSAISLHQLLGRDDVHFLSRGHGGRTVGPAMVDTAQHRARDVGDEPLLLAQQAPCWVSRDRAAGLRAASAAGAKLVIMDDGLQNPSVTPSLRLLAVKGDAGFGNGQLVPAGPLREPLAHGLNRVDAILCIGELTHPSLKNCGFDKPIFRGQYRPNPQAIAAFQNREVIAFAGIAQPNSFFAMLKNQGLQLIDQVAFPDHHAFSKTEWQTLVNRKRTPNVQLVTTQKDWVRLSPTQQAEVTPVPITLEWDNPSAVVGFVTEHLNALTKRQSRVSEDVPHV